MLSKSVHVRVFCLQMDDFRPAPKAKPKKGAAKKKEEEEAVKKVPKWKMQRDQLRAGLRAGREVDTKISVQHTA